jgi:hypothetical protein
MAQRVAKTFKAAAVYRAARVPARTDLLRAATIAVLVICAPRCVSVRDRVIERASVELRCARAKIWVTELPTGRFIAAGCGRRTSYICESKRHRTWWCQSGYPVFEISERIAEKAAVWLSCPRQEIDVHALPYARFEARGCGHAIGYECLSRTDCCAFANPGVHAIAASQAPSAQEPLPNAPSDAASLRGTLSKQVIRDIISSEASKVRACYGSALRGPPFAIGLVDIKFVIGPDGTVQTIAVERSSLERPDIESCILEVMRALQFPPVNGGGTVVATYSFLFETEPPHTNCR